MSLLMRLVVWNFHYRNHDIEVLRNIEVEQEFLLIVLPPVVIAWLPQIQVYVMSRLHK